MAQAQNNNASKTSAATAGVNEVKSSVFHDFLGKKCAPDSSLAVPGVAKLPGEASPSASVSVGASSGGGRGPISSTSDLGSERQVRDHFDGVPYYGPRGTFIGGSEANNKYLGTKRSNSDSIMGSMRDKMPSSRPDLLEGSHMAKLLRNAGGERSRRSINEETSFALNPLRPISATPTQQPSFGGKTEVNTSRRDLTAPLNIGPIMQYPPRAGQILPLGYQASTHRTRDTGPSVLSQGAADEGSRTGMKGSGILSTISTSGAAAEKNLSGNLTSGCMPISGIKMSEPESLSSARRGLAYCGRQMTIFYGGHAHVFDDVHPNKADVIMALAGSNGGSWSTSYAPKSVGPLVENCLPSGENDLATASNLASLRESYGRPSAGANSIHEFGHSERISIPAGVLRGGVVIKDAKAAGQSADPGLSENRGV